MGKKSGKSTTDQHALVPRRRPAESGAAGGTLVVVACSAAAIRGGVIPGMPLAEARGLLELHSSQASGGRGLLRRNGRPPVETKSEVGNRKSDGTKAKSGRRTADGQEFRLEQYDPAADLRALQNLAVWCQRFSPIAGVEPAAAPDSLLLDITGCAHLFGGERDLLRELLRDFGRRGLSVRTAIADSVGAAWAVAHYGHFARLPAGWGGRAAILPPGRQFDALAQLPVEALRLPDKILTTLHELDVRRVDQLRKLPRASLPSRLGPQAIQRLDQALGHLPETITPQRPPEPIRALWLLENPTPQRRGVKLIVRKLIKQVAAQLERRQEGVQQLVCTLGIAGHQPVEIAVGLVHPSASAAHLYDLVGMQLERTAVPGEVASVNVSAVLTASLDSHQRTMFEAGSRRDHWKQSAMLINRLASRLGKKAVLRARLTAEAQPELVTRYESAADIGFQHMQKHPAPAPDPRAPTPVFRPLLLKQEPILVRVVSVVPNGPPIRFSWNGEHVVARSWGPERIATGWWRDQPIARDYYRLETESGRRFWLFRCLDRGNWFLHGVFE